jgi:hypothetical protein
MHHLTRKVDRAARYLDPALVVTLCKACHDGLHSALRRLGLDFGGEREPLVYRTLLVGDHAHRVAASGRSLVLAAPAADALGDLLVEVATALGAGAREGVG